jgi:uncharacterized protein YbjT (DUF2867 family)
MAQETVAVFSASARPGQAQIRQLKAAGYKVRAVSRSQLPIFEGLEVVPADLNDRDSVLRACKGADAVFFTSPTFAEKDRSVEHAATVGSAANEAGVRRLVFNTTSWHPDRLTGVPSMDNCYLRTKAFQDSGVPLTVIRPSLFMDNLLTKWVKPELLSTGEFVYPHKEDLQVSWICLDDVARFMVAAIQDDSLEGQIVDVGGPQTLRPTDVAAMLGEVLGRPVTYRRITPREFGERMYDVFKDVSGQTREEYVSSLEKHYLFKNETNPFYVEMDDTLKRLPVELTPMREWMDAQDWSTSDQDVGSVSG